MTDTEIELLMAYVDDELDAQQRLKVENLINQSEEARHLVEKFSVTASFLKHSLDDIAKQDVPEQLIETLQSPTMGEVIPLKTSKYPNSLTNWPGLAVAAALLLMIGTLIGIYVSKMQESTMTTSIEPLQNALEEIPSGQQFKPKGNNTKITLVATYKTKNGYVCREFKRENIHGLSSGLACRNDAGYWVKQIELAETILTPATTRQEYAPASGSNDPISDMLDKLDAGSVVPVAEEQTLIDNKWHPSTRQSNP